MYPYCWYISQGYKTLALVCCMVFVAVSRILSYSGSFINGVMPNCLWKSFEKLAGSVYPIIAATSFILCFPSASSAAPFFNLERLISSLGVKLESALISCKALAGSCSSFSTSHQHPVRHLSYFIKFAYLIFQEILNRLLYW